MSSHNRTGYIDPNFPNPNGPHDAEIIIYGYTPTIALCILAIILFVASFILHAFQVLKYRVWYFSPLSLACGMEVIGYIFRALSSKKDPYHVIYFVVQYFCIVTAPVFISASIYVCLSKLIAWAMLEGFDRKTIRILRPKLILWGFIICDVIATIAQVAGAALIGNAESHRKSSKTPNIILLSGLAFQTFAFTIFLSLLTSFIHSLHSNAALHSTQKTPFIAALAATSILVFLRTVFRLAETSQGVFGYLSTHEAFFATLEFTPIVLAVGIMAAWHPGRWLPQAGRADDGNAGSEPPETEK